MNPKRRSSRLKRRTEVLNDVLTGSRSETVETQSQKCNHFTPRERFEFLRNYKLD